MEAIYIPQIARALEQTETFDIKEYLSGLDTLTPVQGQLQVTHRGNYLEVAAQAETIITLTCDRCLKQFNQRLQVDTSELIWLQEEEDPDSIPLEREVSLEELVETLPPNGYFKPEEWLYEQLCLEIPHRKLCDRACEGIQLEARQLPIPPSHHDQRWSSLEALRKQMPNN